jgi:hypothetical protein
MKFKIASISGLIIPLSIALVLSAFLGCGGGGSPYGNTAHVYDGTWSLNLKGYTVPAAVTGAPGPASCTEEYTNIVIAHGFGTTTEILDCVNTPSPNYYIDIGVTLTPDAPPAVTGIVKLENTGGGTSPSTGVCIDRVTCTASGLMMTKCGEAASGC